MIPVGFAHTPLNRYKKGDIRKSRRDNSDLDIEILDEHGNFVEKVEEAQSNVSSSGSDSEDSNEVSESALDLDKIVADAVNNARSKYKAAAVTSLERTKLPPFPSPLSALMGFLRRIFKRWVDAERERRMNHVLKDYQRKIIELEAKLREEYLDEIREINREILLTAYRDQIRRNRSIRKAAKKEVSLDRYEEMVKQRNKERRKMDFLFVNMQRWAGENYDRDMLEAERQAQVQVQKEIEKKNSSIEAEKASERALIEEDRVITQNVYSMMRKAGLVAGINPKLDKATKKKPIVSINSVKSVKISPDALALTPEFENDVRVDDIVDLGYETDITLRVRDKEELASKPRRLFRKDYNPFDVNLHEASYCEQLRCVLIGERGALSLAAEFVRGACPRLVGLDMTNCRIKTRGLGRLLYGIKLGNLCNLRRLVLKGNDIGPSGITLIQGVISSSAFLNLRILDLRDNEIGDTGLDILMKMLAVGEVGALEEIMLHRNGITDVGFAMFMKLVPRIHGAYFPRIMRISLDGNKISPEVKKKFKPYPNFISC